MPLPDEKPFVHIKFDRDEVFWPGVGWKPGPWTPQVDPTDADLLREIYRLLRGLSAEELGALGSFVIQKKGGIWTAEIP